MSDVVNLPLPNFDNDRSSTAHGGFAPNENMVKPLAENAFDPPILTQVTQLAEIVEQIHVRRSVRQKRLVIPDNFVVYLTEDAYDVCDVIDPKSYLEVITCSQSSMWIDARDDEMKSMVNMMFGNWWSYQETVRKLAASGYSK